MERAEYKGGVLSGYAKVDQSSVTVQMNGTDYKDQLVSSGDSVVKFEATVPSGDAVKKMPTGTYSVSVKVNDKTTLNGAFVLSDTQTPVTSVRQDNVVSVGSNTDKQVLLSGFKFYLNGNELVFGTNQNARIAGYDANPNTGFPTAGKTYFIKSVTVEVLVDGIYVPINVTVNQSLILR